jgi:phospholipid-transporting ATPase
MEEIKVEISNQINNFNNFKQPLIPPEFKVAERENSPNCPDYIVEINLNPEKKSQIKQEITFYDSLKNLRNLYYQNSSEYILPESNKISTSKYTWLNCIPKILFEQFSKMANLYFLIIAIMQSINEISISQGKPVILLPLSVVVFINGLKDFMEDWKRKKSDDEENSKTCQIYNSTTGEFETRKWEDLKIGEIVKVKENEYFPADIVLINSSEPEGLALIETKNLDGETNLKHKSSNGKLAEKVKIESDIKNLSGILECKPPNEFIYEFDAKMTLKNSSNTYNNINQTLYIDKNSFMLRGCSLRQTSFIYGFVIYVGHSTKIMKNSPNARTKTSRIEKIMNFQIILIFILQTVLSVIGAVLYLIWFSKFKSEIVSYISPKVSEGILFLFYRIGTWTLIFTNLVPISLLVTLEMIKYIQGIFISWDTTIYERNTGTPAKVQTSTLNEELGQVKFIFSDKTGTLTKNYMEFKKMSIGNFTYGCDNRI